MSELFHELGSDLQLSPTGGLRLIAGTVQGQQKIVRRLQTSNLDYLPNLQYGAGIPKMIGSPGYLPNIYAIVSAQMRLEPIVVQNPTPRVAVTSDPGTGLYTAYITYTDNTTLEQTQIRLPIKNQGNQ